MSIKTECVPTAAWGEARTFMERCILVVEDEPDIRTLVSRVLVRAGYYVREAEDGVRALEAIAIEQPALVVADVCMPRLDGTELVQQLIQRPHPIPCILMGATDEDPRHLSVPFLAKPFALAALVGLVARVVTPV